METLSIEAASAIQQSKVANQISFAVAKKSLDAQKAQGQAAVALLQQVAKVSQQVAQGFLNVEV
jgi:hypothetical protein